MGFIDDVLSSLGLDGLLEGAKPKTLLVGFEAGYIQGVKSILKYDGEEISLSVKGGRVTISGSNLYVKKFCEGDVVICGKITSLKKD